MKGFVCALLLLTLSRQLVAETGNPQQARERAAIDALVSATKALAEADLFCRSHADCGHVAYGAKACGGPQGYAVVSRWNWNLQETSYLAARSSAKEGAYNRRWNIISDCRFELPPRTRCAANRCVRN
jgi:hypothetical protein